MRDWIIWWIQHRWSESRWEEGGTESSTKDGQSGDSNYLIRQLSRDKGFKLLNEVLKFKGRGYLSVKARNLCLSVFVCMCVFLKYLYGSGSDWLMWVSTWLLLGSRVCNVTFVWTTMTPWINNFRNALQIPLTLLTIVTIVTCTPGPITAYRSNVRTRANHCRAHCHPPP